MNRCQYCGKEFTDKVVVCPVDGQAVANTAAKTTAVQPVATPSAFNARLVSPISLSGMYRIYLRSSDLIFILTEGAANSILNSIHGFLGPLGALIPFSLWLFSRHKAREFNRRLEEADPVDLIRDNEKNLRLHLSEIREATLDPASFLGFSSKQAGRLNLLVRQGEKMKLELVSPVDLETARQLLAPRLASIFRVNGEWNEAKSRFQKKKNLAPA